MATDLAKAVLLARGKARYERGRGWVLETHRGELLVLGNRRSMLSEATRSARDLVVSLKEERDRASDLVVMLSDTMAERDMMSVGRVKDPSVELIHARAEILRLKAELSRRREA